MEKMRWFLGGVCGESAWRSELLRELATQGLSKKVLFNPQLPPGQWSAEAAAKEDEMKRTARFNLYHLANPLQKDRTPFSLYSAVQLIDGLHNPTQITRAFIDPNVLDPKTAKAYLKVIADLKERFPGCMLSSWGDFVKEIAMLWGKNHQLLAFLAGTCGQNNWRKLLLLELKARGVHISRFFNPQTPPGTWSEVAKFFEDQMRSAADHTFCYIGDPKEARTISEQVPLYSLVEAYLGLYEDSARTVVSIDFESFDGHAKDTMTKFRDDVRLRFPHTTIITRFIDLVALISADLTPLSH